MRAVGEDDEDEVETEDSYDEDENDDNETESDFGDEDMDDVEWNRVTAMTVDRTGGVAQMIAAVEAVGRDSSSTK